MAFHNYQVTFDEDGNVESTILLPEDSEPRKRVIRIREETANKARKVAEDLYSIAE